MGRRFRQVRRHRARISALQAGNRGHFRRLPRLRTGHCAVFVARPRAAGAGGAFEEIREHVAHHGRLLGRMAAAQGDVRAGGEVVRPRRAGALAGCGHAARRRAAAVLRPERLDELHAGGAADDDDAVVHDALAADDGRGADEERRLHAEAADEPGRAGD